MLNKFFLVFIALFSCSVNYVFAEEAKPLVFGVVNVQSAVKTAERWNPILKYLSDNTGYSFQLKMGTTVVETDKMMKDEEFDVVFTNHNFQKQYDGIYKVIARWAGEPINCVIAVPDNSNIKTLKDLTGKKVAFPSKSAFISYAVPMAELNKKHIVVEQVFGGNQEGIMSQLKANQVDAIAANSRFLEKYSAEKNLKYKEIFVSEDFAEIPVLVHPRLSAKQVSAIKKALLKMSTDPQAAQILKIADFKGFDAASEKDYKNARQVYKAIE